MGPSNNGDDPKVGSTASMSTLDMHKRNGGAGSGGSGGGVMLPGIGAALAGIANGPGGSMMGGGGN